MQDEAKLSYVQFSYCNSLNINLSLLITLHRVLNHTSKPQKCCLEGLLTLFILGVGQPLSTTLFLNNFLMDG